ncbi:11-beta-hydroxysteroid dehydrogenase 1A-like [Coffea arabica]|uniref:11-beta-hydroxysteroid dehydrogenase 1A-like n=1 Tax=Coffea arabica TaxID=13443 RepID=A0A6P6SS71_COFAR|nr:11-beta-hydroxysteroid dehydrogenase 1B-like [Coffea arabica]
MALSRTIRMIVIQTILWILLPFFSIYKFLMFFYRYFSTEDIKGKVVLITGASSGIGEHLTYEYAKRGACLVIVARRENLLKEVAENARKLGSPDVVPICADVLKVDDCKRFVEETVDHFGRLDHVVNNAGIVSMCLIEDAADITNLQPVTDVNFWGSVYPTYFAIPHLKRSKGSILVNASSAAVLSPPGLSIYSASKAALVSFYETMRVELASEISITIATLGPVESEITKGKHMTKHGTTEFDSELVNVFIDADRLPAMSSPDCAKAIVDSVCRKERYVTVPKWCKVLFLLKILCPELIEWASYQHCLKIKSWGAKATPVPPRSQSKSD